MTGTIDVLTMLGWIDPGASTPPVGKASALLLRDLLLIGLSAFALMLLLVVWAKYGRFRKSRKRRAGGQKVVRGVTETDEGDDEPEGTVEVRQRYKYRYKRRDHRSRNPTLAETGGLPPSRTNEPSEPT